MDNALEQIAEWIVNGTNHHTDFLWECPRCHKGATVTSANRSHGATMQRLTASGVEAPAAVSVFITCPNSECQQFSLYVVCFDRAVSTSTSGGSRRHMVASDASVVGSWRLVPALEEAKEFPEYVPEPIRQDYTEAHLIRNLSPKASATLARRCLQGMIRDFHGVRERNLKAEIEAIEDKVALLTWQAIDAVRSVGNIGAHMEKDINVIVEVDPGEAAMLLGLIEMVMGDWYVNRHEREQNLKNIVGMGEAKERARKPPLTG